MTFIDIVNYICGKVQDTSLEAIAECKKYVAKRYELTYNAFLWKDALSQVSINVDPATDSYAASGIVLIPNVIERVVGIRTPMTGLKPVPFEYFYRVNTDEWNNSGTPAKFALLNPIWKAITPVTAAVLDWADSDDAATEIQIVYFDQTGNRFVLNQTCPITLTGQFFEIESIFKPASTGALELKEGGTVFGSLEASDTTTPTYQRIRLADKPTAAVVLNVLGKRPVIALTFDQQVPELRNIDNALIALGQGDMLEYLRHYGKAQAKFEEGANLVQELAKMETYQESENRQLIPDSGFGDSNFLTNYNKGGYW